VTVPMWVWVATIAALAVLVTLDIGQARRPHPVGLGEAARWSVIYFGAALLFTLGVWIFAGSGPALEFTTGFLTEKALSVDNLFVFTLVLSAFTVPHRHQPKVLLLGILAALGMRAVFLTAGAELVQRFSIMFLGFGALLIYTAIRLLRTHATPPEITNTRIMRWARQRLPIAEHTTSPQDGALLVRRHGKPAVTGLGLAILTLLAADVIFALDSLPAIFGITQNLYLILTTNAFALLGLRALYFLLLGLLDRLAHLHYGLALVLGLIGVKLTLHYLHTLTPTIPEIPTWLSLTLITAILTATTITSLRTTHHTTQTQHPHRSSQAEANTAQDTTSPITSR
jgi:tellurite resistance protein TerC